MSYPKRSLLPVLIVLSGYFTNAQNVGIGTTSPSYKLTILAPTNNWGIIHTDGTVTIGSYIYSTGIGELGTKSNHPFYLFANNADNPPAIKIGTDSKVGIVSSADPTNFFQVGNVGSSGYSNYHVAFGNGTQASGLTILGNGNSTWQSTLDISLMPRGNSSGYVGINTQSPANFLQIGDLGSSGYGGNNLAFGNGTAASGINQNSSTVNWFSTTNIALMPQGNGHGRVGINTTTPVASLEVDDYVQDVPVTFAYFKVVNAGGPQPGTGGCTGCTADVSILAAANVMATEFDAVSDARIKDIEDVSNSAKDLETLNAIQVTDYTMKDKVKNGNKPFKKIIAQQVEEVYPQVVNKNINYIPNVYQLTSKIEQTAKGCLLSFKTAHNLDKGAEKLQLIDKNGAQLRCDIISIPADNEVIINAPDLRSDSVFVYGQQVNDFRTVDYDGLTTLNISATQELSKLVNQQAQEIEELKKQIENLEQQIKK